jgi:leucyl aminopeptidase
VVTLCKPPSTSTSTLGEEIPEELRKLIEECVEDGSFSAQAKEKYVLRLPPTHSHTHSSSSVSNKTSTSYRHLVLLGLGSSPSSNDYKEVGKQIASLAKDIKAPNVDIHLDSDTHTHTHTETNANISSVLRGLSNSSYNDKRYKGTGSVNDTIDTLKSVTFTGVPDGRVSAVTEMLDLHMLTMRGVTVAKDLVGAPPNSKTPLAIGDFARDIAATCENMECKVLELEECTEAKMGGFLAVQQGSKFPPQFIHMTYKNKNTTVTKKRIAIVGKGLTFDSGGYNLKVGPGSMIEMMKFDMGGMGAVLGAATAVGALDSSLGNHSSLLDGIEVHFISAVCENMISRDAMRPGDIVTASNGKTIEILNTG